MKIRTTVTLLILFSLVSTSFSTSVAAGNGVFLINNIDVIDSSGRKVDFNNPASINELITVKITLQYSGESEMELVKFFIEPFLGSYLKKEYNSGSEIPIYDPFSEVNLSKSMNNLFEINPIMIEKQNVKNGDIIYLNYSIMLKTSGTWNFNILITEVDNPEQILGGSSIYIHRNLPGYVDALIVIIPLILGGAMFGLVIIIERRSKIFKK